MEEIKIGDIMSSEDGNFMFQIIDEKALGRGVKYIGERESDVRFKPKSIKINTTIAEFVGTHLIWHPKEEKNSSHNAEFERKRAEFVDYLVALDRAEEHLLIPSKEECVAFLINTKPKSNNCKISIAQNRAFVKTTKTIDPGDTIYISYGAAFVKRLGKKEEKEVIVISDDSDFESEPKGFNCPKCGKNFKKKSTLNKHLTKHS